MSRPSSLRLILVSVIAAIAVLIAWQRPSHPAPATASPSTAPDHHSTRPASPAPREPGASVSRTTPERPVVSTLSLPVGENAHQAIEALTITYDAASVPPLARFLDHADPEIRAAAREGLIQLGERAAIPFLEKAAKTAPSEEAPALREAAEYLALPTWTERRAAEKARATGDGI